MEKKEIFVWYLDLQEPYRTQAKRAVFKAPLADRNTLVGSLKSALLRGFIWGSTEQGIKYWENIYQGNYPIAPMF